MVRGHRAAGEYVRRASTLCSETVGQWNAAARVFAAHRPRTCSGCFSNFIPWRVLGGRCGCCNSRSTSTSNNSQLPTSLNSSAGGSSTRPPLKKWFPPSRWLPSEPDAGRQGSKLGGEDYRRTLQYDLARALREPLPKDLAHVLNFGLKRLRLDENMLLRMTRYMAALPKSRIDSACQNGRRAAVMVPLCIVDGKVSVMFNVRSQFVTTHKGEVCFPGGHLDMADECMEATADRECEEEVGLRVGVTTADRALWRQEWSRRPYYPRSNILGRLPNCVSFHGTLVTPVVGFLGSLDIKALMNGVNKQEIQHIFSMTIEELVDVRGIERVEDQDLPGSMSWPAFVAGPHRVWGMTALILHHFLIEVMLPCIMTCPASLRELAKVSVAEQKRVKQEAPLKHAYKHTLARPVAGGVVQRTSLIDAAIWKRGGRVCVWGLKARSGVSSLSERRPSVARRGGARAKGLSGLGPSSQASRRQVLRPRKA